LAKAEEELKKKNDESTAAINKSVSAEKNAHTANDNNVKAAKRAVVALGGSTNAFARLTSVEDGAASAQHGYVAETETTRKAQDVLADVTENAGNKWAEANRIFGTTPEIVSKSKDKLLDVVKASGEFGKSGVKSMKSYIKGMTDQQAIQMVDYFNMGASGRKKMVDAIKSGEMLPELNKKDRKKLIAAIEGAGVEGAEEGVKGADKIFEDAKWGPYKVKFEASQSSLANIRRAVASIGRNPYSTHSGGFGSLGQLAAPPKGAFAAAGFGGATFGDIHVTVQNSGGTLSKAAATMAAEDITEQIDRKLGRLI
jgi:hypothetical protein